MIQNPPLISVIIPAYNAENYLRRALDSLSAQTMAEWEAVCINDGSTDSTAAVLDDYAARDSRFVVRHTENGGAARARNAALTIARGEYITMLDADDWLDADTLEKLSALLRDNPHAALSVADFTRHAADGTTSVWGHRRGGAPLCGIQPADAHNLSSMLVCSCGKMYRRALIEQYSLQYRIGQKVGEDAYFVMCYLAHAEHIAFIPEGLYHYADSDTSIVSAYYAGKVPLETYLGNLTAPLHACEYAETITFSTPSQSIAYFSYLLNRALFAYTEYLHTGGAHHPQYREPIQAAYREMKVHITSHLPLHVRIGLPLRYYVRYWSERTAASLRYRLNKLLVHSPRKKA